MNAIALMTKGKVSFGGDVTNILDTISVSVSQADPNVSVVQDDSVVSVNVISEDVNVSIDEDNVNVSGNSITVEVYE